MFWRNNRIEKRKEQLQENITEYEQKLAKYEMFISDFKQKYLPFCSQLRNLIIKKKLNIYPLKYVLNVKYLGDNVFRFQVNEIIEEYWDGLKTITASMLFDKYLSLNVESFSDSELRIVLQELSSLKESTCFEIAASNAKAHIKEYKTELEKLEEIK
jgi:hypothetical protein